MTNRIDFGRHSEDYAAHRAGPPESFYRRIDGIRPIVGAHTLDLATGPGTIALELGARGGSVVGIDTSEGQIAVASRVAKERGLEARVRFRVARAEATRAESDAFDLATAGQCWHWFDVGAVMAELHRVLRPGGILVVVDYSYLAGHAPVARDTEELILELNPSWTMAGSNGMFPERIDELIRGGFDFVEEFCFDHDEPFSHSRWRGRMRTCNGVGSGGLPPSEVERFDRALDRLLGERYPDPVLVPHRLWCVVARNPS